MLEKYGFVAATLALVCIVVSVLKQGRLAGYAVGAIVIGVSHFGPQIFGRDWFYQGFWAGIVLGGFLEYAMLNNADSGPSETASK